MEEDKWGELTKETILKNLSWIYVRSKTISDELEKVKPTKEEDRDIINFIVKEHIPNIQGDVEDIADVIGLSEEQWKAKVREIL